MAFLDLHEGILGLFADAQGVASREEVEERWCRWHRARRRELENERRALSRKLFGPGHRRKEYEHIFERRQQRRQAWLETGPTCAICGKAIERVSKAGPVPSMCSKRCRALSWWRKNKGTGERIPRVVARGAEA